jgi:hypothetical protein
VAAQPYELVRACRILRQHRQQPAERLGVELFDARSARKPRLRAALRVASKAETGFGCP